MRHLLRRALRRPLATQSISQGGESLSLDDLWDRWRLENPTPEEAREDLQAVKESIRDMENGDHGAAVEDHIRDMRKRYGLPADA